MNLIILRQVGLLKVAGLEHKFIESDEDFIDMAESTIKMM